MADKQTITLEGTDYEIIVPLTLGQLTDLKIAVAQPAASDDIAENIRQGDKRARGVILAAVSPEAGLTDEKLLGMRITPQELNTAVNAILVGSGLVLPKAPEPGEAQPEAPAAE